MVDAVPVLQNGRQPRQERDVVGRSGRDRNARQPSNARPSTASWPTGSTPWCWPGQPRDLARIESLRRTGTVIAGWNDSQSQAIIAELEQPGTRDMCEALARLGHHRIAFVSRRHPTGTAGSRRWRASAGQLGRLHVEAERVTLRGRNDQEGVASILAAVVRRADPVTALISASHSLAPLLLRGAAVADIDLPADCSFVAYGDSEWAAAYRPAISVVTADLYAIAAQLTRRAIDELEGRAPSADGELSPARFIQRQSVSQPRQPQHPQAAP